MEAELCGVPEVEGLAARRPQRAPSSRGERDRGEMEGEREREREREREEGATWPVAIPIRGDATHSVAGHARTRHASAPQKLGRRGHFGRSRSNIELI